MHESTTLQIYCKQNVQTFILEFDFPFFFFQTSSKNIDFYVYVDTLVKLVSRR